MKSSDASFTPFEISRGGHTFLIREARSDSKELDDIAWGAAGAFLDDIVMNWFSGVTEVSSPQFVNKVIISSQISQNLYRFRLLSLLRLASSCINSTALSSKHAYFLGEG